MEQPTLSRDQARSIDRCAIEDYGVPGILLMENAGSGTARWLHEIGILGQILILCGKGNNGGDGYVIARHLEGLGHDPVVVLTGDWNEVSGDAKVNLEIIEKSGTGIIPWREFVDRAQPRECDWIVDGLLGTGVRGQPREPNRSAIHWINQQPCRKMAIDVPSGLDCDSGEPLGEAVRADYTSTFVAAKLGFQNPVAQPYIGTVRVIDIGAPRAVLERIREKPPSDS